MNISNRSRQATAVLLGIRAALLTPHVIRSGAWHSLLTDVPVGPAIRYELAARTSLRALRILSRLPGSVWRTTCFYRAVAVCVVLRRCGLDAVLRLGAQAGEALSAHAWVESSSGEPLYETQGPFRPLTRKALTSLDTGGDPIQV